MNPQDVLEILEKRVKSRFSHRQLHVFPAWRFADLLELFRLYLSLPPSFPDAAFAAKWNESVQVRAASRWGGGRMK